MTNMPSHYGAYAVPKTIRKLLELEQELTVLGLSLDRAFPFMLLEHDFRYHTTPIDVIPLASTGMDGIHYAFLTDFGRVSDLEQAWIVTVSPMDSDRPVWPVAANLREFLQAAYTDADALINNFDTGESYREYVRTRNPVERDEQEQLVREQLVQRFGIKPIADMGQYLDDLRVRRAAEAVLPTEDRLGVVPINPDHGNTCAAVIPSIDRDFDWEERRNEIERFWQQASADSKRIFLRHAQLHSIFQFHDCLNWFCERLEEEGMQEYAKNLMDSFGYFEYEETSDAAESITEGLMWDTLQIEDQDEKSKK
ncbi:hypothetical protein [Saccharibacillus kuerlensis]|uniref:SUKH superfamily protein n=1 Tax=Saccharibacillus kuerlensis TaxID=459527 RepID=A0ABQ2L1N0_9BACL|nr:hypothetical protein [Saccharibacillus kuerlensis]GGN98118.1 hypothetical protein GCM10010969_16770 [Saccharibacillus kuerlensis]